MIQIGNEWKQSNQTILLKTKKKEIASNYKDLNTYFKVQYHLIISTVTKIVDTPVVINKALQFTSFCSPRVTSRMVTAQFIFPKRLVEGR